MSPVSYYVEQEEAAAVTSEVVDLAEHRECIQRLTQSRHFSKAPLLTSFLWHVCERSFAMPGDRITEYEIGVQVFRRSRSFDPRQDNIVRTYARLLRKRLEEYYSTDGSGETLRILLPKGGYTPVFERQGLQHPAPPLEPTEDAQLNPQETCAPAVPQSKPKPGWPLWTGLSAWLCSVLIFGITWRTLHIVPQQRAKSSLHALWSQMFPENRDTFVIPGDVGFVIMQQANHRTFTLAEYLGWQSANHARDNLVMSYLKDQSYTSMLSLDVVSQLQRLPEVSPPRFLTRAPRALRLEDLQTSNAILLGSNFSNPWTELFSRQLNFHFVNHPESDRNWISNSAPAPGEPAVYENNSKSYRHPTYGVIAFLPGLGKKRHVLLIEGLDAAGTQAAVKLLFDDTDAMSAFLAGAIGPDGSIKSFEILVEATSFGYDSRAVDCHMLAKRIHS